MAQVEEGELHHHGHLMRAIIFKVLSYIQEPQSFHKKVDCVHELTFINKYGVIDKKHAKWGEDDENIEVSGRMGMRLLQDYLKPAI